MIFHNYLINYLNQHNKLNNLKDNKAQLNNYLKEHNNNKIDNKIKHQIFPYKMINNKIHKIYFHNF